MVTDEEKVKEAVLICFEFAVGGGLRLAENIPTDVNKKERFAYFVARDKVCATAA